MADEAQAIEPAQVRERIARSEAVVLDVQDEAGWGRAHIVNANHVSEGELDDALDEVPEDQFVIVVCGDGKRSRELAEKLSEGGRRAASISGGMDAWLGAGFQVQPSPDADRPREEPS
jgi:rhodanese-related sulfurtransferase